MDKKNECIAGNGQISERSDTGEYKKNDKKVQYLYDMSTYRPPKLTLLENNICDRFTSPVGEARPNRQL